MRFIEKYQTIIKENESRVAYIDSNESLTYKQLDERASKIYAFLKQKGIGKEDFVLISLHRGVNTIAAMLGIMKAGAAFCALEDTYPQERVEYIKKDLKFRLNIDGTLLREIYSSMQPLEGFEKTDLHDAAYAVYTSGSTGNPKGVLHEYGNIDQTMETCLHDPQNEIRGFVPPFYFVAGFIVIIKDIVSANTVYILPHDLVHDFNRLKAFIYEKKLDSIYLPPAYIRLYTDPSPYLKSIATGSEPANGLYYPGGKPKIINSYSMSEAGFQVLKGELDRKYDVAPVGKPTLPIPYYLFDENGEEVKGAGQGELCFLNEYVRGYINLPERTNAVWKNGVYHTGDIARRDEEGRYYILGRIDDMIKINGNRIEPAEIEARVQDLTGLKKVIAKGFKEKNRSFICVYYIGKEAEKLGVVRNGKLEIKRDELRRFLPEYMIPAYYVALESFPLNANGKIAKKELECPGIPDLSQDYEAPENEMERYFCEKMAEILKLERFSAAADFFEMGAGSIDAVNLSTKCETYPVTTKMLYKYRTPRLLAANIVPEESKDFLEEQNKLALKEAYPLLPPQLLSLQNTQKKGSAKVSEISSLQRIREGVDIERLSSDIDHILSCHPALCTRLFPGENHTPYQVYDPGFAGKTQVVSVDEEKFDSYLDERYREGMAELFGTRLYDSEILHYKGEYYYYLSISHLIADGASFKLILDDISKRFSDEAYEPEEDYWFLILKRYWSKRKRPDTKADPDQSPEKQKEPQKRELSAEERKYFRAIRPDREAFPGKGSVISIPDAFPWKETYNGTTFAAAVLLAQCWFNKTDRAALMSVFNNRNERININAFGMLATGLGVYVTIDNKDTAPVLLKKVEEEIREGLAGGGFLQQIKIVPGDLLYMMRYNFLYNLFENKASALFEKQIPIRSKKENASGAIATNIVYQEGGSCAGLRVVYSTDLYDRETIEHYIGLLNRAMDFLNQDKTIEEFSSNFD